MSEIQRLTDGLREANLAQRELIARMRAAVLAEQLGDRGMDWIEAAVEGAGLWPPIDGPDALSLYNAEMAEQRRLRNEWAAEVQAEEPFEVFANDPDADPGL